MDLSGDDISNFMTYQTCIQTYFPLLLDTLRHRRDLIRALDAVNDKVDGPRRVSDFFESIGTATRMTQLQVKVRKFLTYWLDLPGAASDDRREVFAQQGSRINATLDARKYPEGLKMWFRNMANFGVADPDRVCSHACAKLRPAPRQCSFFTSGSNETFAQLQPIDIRGGRGRTVKRRNTKRTVKRSGRTRSIAKRSEKM